LPLRGPGPCVHRRTWRDPSIGGEVLVPSTREAQRKIKFRTNDPCSLGLLLTAFKRVVRDAAHQRGAVAYARFAQTQSGRFAQLRLPDGQSGFLSDLLDRSVIQPLTLCQGGNTPSRGVTRNSDEPVARDEIHSARRRSPGWFYANEIRPPMQAVAAGVEAVGRLALCRLLAGPTNKCMFTTWGLPGGRGTRLPAKPWKFACLALSLWPSLALRRLS
jgi:hypothetical protein